MSEEDLKRRIAYLESLNDYLVAEISQVDNLMRLVGFSNGLETVKQTAKYLKDELNDVLENESNELQ